MTSRCDDRCNSDDRSKAPPIGCLVWCVVDDVDVASVTPAASSVVSRLVIVTVDVVVVVVAAAVEVVEGRKAFLPHFTVIFASALVPTRSE